MHGSRNCAALARARGILGLDFPFNRPPALSYARTPVRLYDTSRPYARTTPAGTPCPSAPRHLALRHRLHALLGVAHLEAVLLQQRAGGVGAGPVLLLAGGVPDVRHSLGPDADVLPRRGRRHGECVGLDV